VKTHFEHVYEKLGVSDRASAVAVALRGGLFE
jgi:DNA-binding NarL/FixJ family response regulator